MRFLMANRFGISTTPTKSFGSFSLAGGLYIAGVFYVMLFIIGSDHDSNLDWSIWLNVPLGIRPSVLLIFGVMISNVFMFRHMKFDRVYWLLLTVLLFGVIGSVVNPHFFLNEWIIDFKFFVIVLGLYGFTRIMFDRFGVSVWQLVSALFLLAGFVYVRDLVQLITNSGTEFIPGVTRISLDSTKPLLLLFVVLSGLLLAHRRFMVTAAILLVVALTVSFGYGSRMVFIDIVFILLISAFMLPRKIYASFFVAVVFGSFIAAGLLYAINPPNAEITFTRADDIIIGQPQENFSVPTEYNFVSRIDSIRYAQFQNIFLQDLDFVSLFIGRGVGGSYGDDYIRFPRNIGSTFTAFEFETGRFFRTHNFVSHFFLKYGLVGLAVFAVVWFYPLCSSRNYWLRVRRKSVRDIFILSVFIFLPITLIEFTWSGKGMMFSGIFLAVVYQAVSMLGGKRAFSYPW